MKIRSSFVSNSSSSSFILEDVPELAGLSSRDWKNFLNDSTKHMEVMGKVYDLKQRYEHSMADKEQRGVLSAWVDTCVKRLPDGTLQKDGGAAAKQWRAYIKAMTDREYDGWWLDIDVAMPLSQEETQRGLGRYDGKQYLHKPMPGSLVLELYAKWIELGVVTNCEAMESDKARFLFHFGENEIDYIKGMDNASGYETEPLTVERFFEIAVRYFKDKLPPECTWKTLKDALIACTMHEG